jgi:hypothetical protein
VNLIVKILISKKTLILLSLIMILTFSFLFLHSIRRLNDYQSYLNDVDRLNELNQVKIDTDHLLVNPFSLTLIKDYFRSTDPDNEKLNTESINSAFFFNIENNSVQLYRIQDIIDHAKSDDTITLDATDYRMHRRPEGLFGESLIYLCESDNILSDAIRMIRSIAKPNASFDVYESYMETLNRDTMIPSLFDRYDKEMYEATEIVLNRFHPEKTLYVNDLGWKTEASSLDSIEQIVFDSKIETIPTFDWTDLTQTNGEKIRLYDLNIPSSVKRIETGAFPEDLFDILFLRLNSLDGLILEDHSISGISELDLNIPLFAHRDTIDFSDHVEIEIDLTGQVNFDFDGMLPYIQQYGITSYNAKNDMGIAMIVFYSNDFLIGFSTNIQIITYYLTQDAKHPYHIKISNETTFKDVEIPNRSGYTFNGWKFDDVMIFEGDELPNKTFDVYADWIQTSE